MIRVLLADDHRIVRDALRYLLQVQADMEVIAEAVDGQDAIDQAHSVCPDVAVLDLSMPRIDATYRWHRGCKTNTSFLLEYSRDYANNL